MPHSARYARLARRSGVGRNKKEWAGMGKHGQAWEIDPKTVPKSIQTLSRVGKRGKAWESVGKHRQTWASMGKRGQEHRFKNQSKIDPKIYPKSIQNRSKNRSKHGPKIDPKSMPNGVPLGNPKPAFCMGGVQKMRLWRYGN